MQPRHGPEGGGLGPDLALLLVEVVALRQPDHLLDGLGRQRVLLDRLEDGLVSRRRRLDNVTP